MAKRAKTKSKKPIEQYEHKDKKRVNNPPVGLVDASTDAPEGKKTYAYDPHLDPSLQWSPTCAPLRLGIYRPASTL
jgi:adenine-specific DNA-methyltransferase